MFAFLSLILFDSLAYAASPSVRIKDIAHVLEARENQLMGFGLVVGLNNSGDKTQTGFSQQALTNLLSRMGMVPQGIDFKSKNVAAVMVTATLPPFIKPGQKLDVTISSVGDANSLQGGTLLVTPLHGVDDNVYAVAQGNLLVGLDPSTPNVPYLKHRQTTVGRIPNGALVEKEVPVSIGTTGFITIVLDSPDFTTASRVESSLLALGLAAVATDAAAITVPVVKGESLVTLVTQIENATVVPDSIAKIIINERTGTIVVGENVKIAPVAVSYAGIDVVIGDIKLFSEGSDYNYSADEMRYQASSQARMNKSQGMLRAIPASPTLSNLVTALNTIGASPRDLIAIIQAMKKVGAIKADLEVI
ncbi:hypothetical protein A2291_07145 [candidate division WOR-1 bacterium RIFOXYB2_FULL_42_35]|uniref:Flagellar P-ring protein n=1 Tax=candidate division WOR-1 bacterium RIFOXYC2_FULL_41_25 TaxID=1802586 RepID=A0A1F4TKK7_UNCSA|nr:MAG: hypothetical protein A2247_04485 [candidate division WOR-1 bacterium RIFOXYA2_FULL_41_14]OGC22523.1 MAG: hypothetical protein A2291_07145 [candidate division WOR-1 bacterium RIFOXYB2_FULL_42_35]OGC33261.1 MAG: hypothetical protein A2462_07320 [candidate division WOR-1 bacterium RIFOXYC2_FULL_41_25]OGC43497.1 MAG: hypothetical protein A2548_00905 [candidate division WOR-1 bacterium RIFOXYD2_FULL_41_8]